MTNHSEPEPRLSEIAAVYSRTTPRERIAIQAIRDRLERNGSPMSPAILAGWTGIDATLLERDSGGLLGKLRAFGIVTERRGSIVESLSLAEWRGRA